MERMTRVKDKWPCRINNCEAEDWIIDHGGEPDGMCDDCPFEQYINKLAEYEDNEVNSYDDCK